MVTISYFNGDPTGAEVETVIPLQVPQMVSFLRPNGQTVVQQVGAPALEFQTVFYISEGVKAVFDFYYANGYKFILNGEGMVDQDIIFNDYVDFERVINDELGGYWYQVTATARGL